MRASLFFAALVALAPAPGCASPLDASAPGWQRVASSGTTPAPRWGQAAVYDDAGHRMLVFGGETAAGETAELWSLDLGTHAWSLVATGPGPSPRANPAAVLDAARGRLVVFGGRQGATTTLGDAWSLDLATLAWTELAAGPPPRQRAHAATDGARAWFYGGEGFLSVSSDLWELDLATLAWTELPTPGEGPGGRTCGAFAYFAGALFLVGGHDVATPKDGTFRYDLAAHRWSQLATAGGTTAGAHWAYATDDLCRRLYLAGGDHLDNYDTSLTDVLALDGAAFTPLRVSALPPVHDHATLVVDTARRELVLYGGTVGDGMAFLGDAWTLPLPACP